MSEHTVWNVEGARLGLATTRQLLRELAARGGNEVARSAENYTAAEKLFYAATGLLETLPEEILSYRTVD